MNLLGHNRPISAAVIIFTFCFIPSSLVQSTHTTQRASHQDDNADKIRHISSEELEGITAKIEKFETHDIPRADNGKTRVYLPKEFPAVVLKHSGRDAALKRFQQMQTVRAILDKQKSSHLVIPNAKIYKDFLVEERLPINVDYYHNMELYLSQTQLFDDAVHELTRLFSKIYIGDLVDYQRHPLGHINGVEDQVRYDNLPMYITEKNGKKEGKIGLIDLEHMEDKSQSYGLEKLARIFPLHLDIIKNEAKKLKMEINQDLLDAAAERGKKYLHVGFIDHLTWLEKKGISTPISHQPFQINSQREPELTMLLQKELLKINEGINDLFTRKGYLEKPQKDFFTHNPEEAAKELATGVAPLIMSNIKAQIDKQQNKQLSKLLEQNITKSQLVHLRSPVIKRSELYRGVDRLITQHKRVQVTYPYEERDVAEQLLYIVLEELVKSGEIFYFDPAYYTGGHDLCWIRY
jgi:hypothetical protein